jgi:hypothetical protein
MGLQSTDLRLTNMRSLQSRIVKLERRTRHQGEILLIWCAEDEDVESAIERARPLFTADDRVAIARWYGDDVPAPRWHEDFPKRLSELERTCLDRFFDDLCKANNLRDVDLRKTSPLNHQLTDSELWYEILRVDRMRDRPFWRFRS